MGSLVIGVLGVNGIIFSIWMDNCNWATALLIEHKGHLPIILSKIMIK